MARFVIQAILTGLLVTVGWSQEPDLFTINKKGKWGYIDRSGKVVISLKFDAAWDFSDGLAAVQVGNDWGFIDKTGRFVIWPQFCSGSNFIEGLASVCIYWPDRETKRSPVGYDGYTNKKGEIITKDRFSVAFNFSDGYAHITTEDYKSGFVDRTGKVVLYSDPTCTEFKEGRCSFRTAGPDSRAGFIDKTGTVVIPARYRYARDFSEGLACVNDGKGSGFIDLKGNTVIDLQYDACGDFSEGLAYVVVGEKIGFIDRSGEMVIKPQFVVTPGENARFSEGVAIVRVNEDDGPAREFVRGEYIVRENKWGLFGVIDKTGKFIIPPKYTQIGDFHNGLAWVNLSDSYVVHGADPWGYINKAGKIVWRSR